MKNPHKVIPQLFAALIGSWGFFMTGTVRGWSSPAIPSLNTTLNFEMDHEDFVWISSLAPLAALFGSLLMIAPLRYFGRRKSLIAISLPALAGFILMGYTRYIRHKEALYAGRIITGLMNGASIPASQIYVSECSSSRIRGTLSSLTATLLALGILITYIIGAFVDWYVLSFIVGGFNLIMFFGMIFMPESPIWLLANNQDDEAKRSLQRLRGERTNIEAEFQRMKDNQQKNLAQNSAIQPSEFLKGFVWKPLGVSMGLMFFQQFTGINAMVFYTTDIFTSAGSALDCRYATIIIGVVQFLCTVVSGFLVDRFGRRILLFTSATFVSISLGLMGVFFYLQELWGESEATELIGWLPLSSLIVFFIAFSTGFSNVPFIVMGELFPTRYRGLLGPISSSFNLLCTFIVVRTFPDMEERMSVHGTFWFFMCCTLASMVFVYFLLPETKGHTLEEIEQFFSKRFHGAKDSTKSDDKSDNQSDNKSDHKSDNKSDVYIITDDSKSSYLGQVNLAYDCRQVKRVDITSFTQSQDDSDNEEDDGSLVPIAL